MNTHPQSSETSSSPMPRRDFVKTAVGGVLAAGLGSALAPSLTLAAEPAGKAAVLNVIPGMHAENLKRLQEWIALPSIAAEDRNYPQGPQYMAELARSVGFKDVRIVPTSGKPGVFGRLDAGAKTTVGVYFMYDVKHFVPEEWESPPLEARLIKKEGLGTVVMGRGAVNQKGPENSFLSALAAFQRSGQRLPVNLVLVCEGEEEIGSPHFGEVVHDPKVLEALKGCVGVFMPDAGQDRDGGVQISLGAKGVVELELIASGERWGRGPKTDVHSSLEAYLDSPSWHLVQALNTLVAADGHTPAVEGFFEHVKPLSDAHRAMIAEYARTTSEERIKQIQGVTRWVHDLPWQQALERLVSQPTINIEGLVGGYTGPGGKTVLPHRAVAKIDMRLVPDMTAQDTLNKLRNHLAKHGFGDIEVKMSGGYDPNSTSEDSHMIRSQIATYQKMGIDARLWPRRAGSWPGFLFTGAPLNLPAGHFGLGHGTGAHAPNEYYLIDSVNPNVRGLDGAVASFVEYLYALA